MMIVKEAIHNVIKHARATEVTVRVNIDGQLLLISITDNGCGFEPAIASSGNGLVNLNRRIQDIGGTCHIESRPGEGAAVRLRLSICRKD
jgi:signal transduction histidine kinase